MKTKPVILVLTGSFNPVTMYHLRILDVVEHHLETQENSEILCSIISPVHDKYGKEGLVSSFHRVKMVELAIKDRKNTIIDTWESSQRNYSRTVHVLNHIRRDICQNNEVYRKAQIRLVLGMDVFSSMPNPSIWSEQHVRKILEEFTPVIIHREDIDHLKIIEQSAILKAYQDKVTFVCDFFKCNLSSTMVRRGFAENLPLRWLVHPLVINYVTKNHLYNT